ncbi:MAG: hypothetical protein LBC99_03945 [Spirochaetota bacterium]|jgi:hypothetical protein|nr:hypothetical protein [Spirochaetota bacterium]
MKDNRYYLDATTQEDVREMIESGTALFFRFRERDYFIEPGCTGYFIQDPQIGEDGNSSDIPYTDYPGHEEARTPEELYALPFLDSKTIFERFDEIRFFDVGITLERLKQMVEDLKKE